ncbi:1-aminocyclopropane-1-carboxylate deaminase [Halanaeroarchaeum sp. HSR-CO]|uniref:pyridoxal-phosphate dependent enzyme n=1 Tax=Halanaeroarchaeum sp. HSR-CO TaxID=2866382 RepID=UPI00217E7818|nr:pyridoxal-phosphate dependent enzyme [Halanaeroarchaeum sp. HSR-CO]UWG48111.1 1-aminocyclopropane-1-carboxylate deaminase [Halanaeroarchaeum sp. HSR-CO]
MTKSREYLEDKIELFSKPTPLEELTRVSSTYRANFWIKRDDLTSIGAGGNKARKLEYILYDAVDSGADTLVTLGSIQSNHARMTAATAAKLGLECHLILITDTGSPPDKIEGNRLLEEILNVDISYTTSSNASAEIDRIMENLKSKGKSPYFIEGGGHSGEGALGYFSIVGELLDQISGDSIDYLVTATGTGTTHAGLLAGLAQQNIDVDVVGISVARSTERCKEEIKDILTDINRKEGLTITNFGDIIVYDEYVGEGGYGTATDRALDAVKSVAQLEGIFLEPTYTGKAFGAMLDLLNGGELDDESNIVFLHTGGFPGLFVSRFQNGSVWTT